MNFDRFRFKAISKHDGEWKFATLNFIGDSCSVRWQHEWEKSSYTHSGWIVPETLCICTGLHDSDGKLIYENDIIQTEYNDKTAEFVVKYLPNDFSYEIDGKTGCCPLALVKCWIEHGEKVVVVGNKFDSEVEKK